MHHDRPLSAIVPSSRLARPSLPGWRRTSYASRSAPQRHRVQIHGSLAHSPPGLQRPSYAVRSAPQRHRTQLTFSSSIPSRVATNVLCITIGPSAPSCPDSRFGSPIPFQDGNDRLMQYDRPLSAIVPSSRSARPSLPGWRRTSYASRSAPQRHRVQIHGSARPFPPGWRRPSYAVRSAPQRHRTQLTFSSSIPSRVATNVLCITIGPSAPSCPDSRFDSPIPLQDGDDRLMQYDRPLSAIVPSSRLARPSLPGWRRTSYASRSAPQRHRVQIHGSARPFPPGWRRPSYAVRSAP
ncbi:unnamed protein product [Cuscuta epithymum]|uniref:Uncharacterized protein n=1 Tax=Cuscuta epithymum TaxID=186058 RepID=A0AAV0EGE0_9ASTE|nr:unnamed protein product [Cuscuta epithymum]